MYNYYFYRIYKRQRTKESVFFSLFMAIGTVSIIGYLNFLTIITFLIEREVFLKFSNELYAVIIGVVLIMFNCLWFLYKDRYKAIEAKYLNESKLHANLGTAFLILYPIFSFVLYIVAIELSL